MKKADQMTEHDLEPFLALVSELEQARLGKGWEADENGEAIPTSDETTDRLLNIYWSERLFDLYWQGRNAYDAMAAKIEGAKPYAEIMGEGSKEIERKEGF